MTRRSALILFSLGPLSVSEFHQIDGAMSYKAANRLILRLRDERLIKAIKRGVYAIV